MPNTSIALSASYLSFQSEAFQTNKKGGHNQNWFNALCGDNPPQIVDGYGKWTVIDRPLRQGLTIPAGFNPAKVKIEIRFGVWDGRFGFDGWDTSRDAALSVEKDIDSLHWMAGGNELGGPSPVVYIDSYRPDKGRIVRTDLMPRQYRGVAWIIDSGVEWGASLRDRDGSRILQEASFTVMGYTMPPGAPKPPHRHSEKSGGFFKTTRQYDTARRIAGAHSSQASEAGIANLARGICKAPRNNPCKGHPQLKLERRSIDWKIRPGIDIWVPAHPL